MEIRIVVFSGMVVIMPRLYVNYRRFYDSPATPISTEVEAGHVYGILVRSYHSSNLPPETCVYVLQPGVLFRTSATTEMCIPAALRRQAADYGVSETFPDGYQFSFLLAFSRP